MHDQAAPNDLQCTSRPTCNALIDLSRPARSERVRGFQPPWRTVFVYVCPTCNATHRVRASSFRGRTATPSVGAIRCGREETK